MAASIPHSGYARRRRAKPGKQVDPPDAVAPARAVRNPVDISMCNRCRARAGAVIEPSSV
jgi:hypothetical protein